MLKLAASWCKRIGQPLNQQKSVKPFSIVSIIIVIVACHSKLVKVVAGLTNVEDGMLLTCVRGFWPMNGLMKPFIKAPCW